MLDHPRSVLGDGKLMFKFRVNRLYRAVKCGLIWHFRGQALLLRVLHVVASDNVPDCVFLKDDLNRVNKGLNSYELNLSLLLDYCIRSLINQSIFISIRQKPIHTHRHTSSSSYFIWKDTCIVHSNIHIHIHACTKHNHNTQPAVRTRNINTLTRCVNTRHWLF